MPSDAHLLPYAKKYIDPPEGIVAFVRQRHPTATADGCCGAWSFQVNGQLIGEAWLHARRPGWWLRLISPDKGAA